MITSRTDRSDERPASIRSLGLVVILLSAAMIFSNTMGALSYGMLDIGSSDALSADAIWSNYLEMCASMVVTGMLYLVSGIFIRKYRLWANRLATIVTSLLIVGVWVLMALMSWRMGQEGMVSGLQFFPYVVAIAVSIPLGLLVRFLNRKHILAHFS